MNTILNIIWLLFGGISLAIGWVISGILCFIGIVTIPFAGACFDMAGQILMPFGKIVVEKKHLDNEVKPRPIASTIWIIFMGIWLFIGHIISGILMICTIVGIPFGMQIFKVAQISLNPYKYTLVDKKILGSINK